MRYASVSLLSSLAFIAILPAKRVLQSLPAVEEAQAVARKRKSFA